MQISGGKLRYEENNTQNKKISKIILAFIIVMFVAIIAIICTIIYIQKNALTVYIDGKTVSLKDGIIIKDDNSDKLYIDIKGIAEYLGYSAHNGEYKIETEDTNKCWVECKNETASFYLNSNKISKVAPNTTDDYEDYTITDSVLNKNGKLYSTEEGIEIGFNVSFSYNSETNTITIYTLSYLVNYYSNTLKTSGFNGTSESFANQKAVLYGLFVVQKDNNLYGVIDSSGEEIIGSRYKSIEFNENGKEFYVKNNSNKIGIMTNTGATKISIVYDSIDMIDKNSGLYVVKNNNKYGVLDSTGSIVIYLEYEKIGIDTSKFSSDNISNKYLLYESVIPVYQNEKWGLFNTKGEIVVPVEYDEIGCSVGISGNSSANNVLLIPNYKGIVFGKKVENSNDKKYGVYNNEGELLIPFGLDNVYSITSAGVLEYKMEYHDTTSDLEEYLVSVYGDNNP